MEAWSARGIAPSFAPSAKTRYSTAGRRKAVDLPPGGSVVGQARLAMPKTQAARSNIHRGGRPSARSRSVGTTGIKDPRKIRTLIWRPK
jgi:hypothetical protein